MSVIRQANFLGQQRLDIPHLRAIDSSVAADFDLLAGRILAGERPLVVRGFDLITTLAIGNPATDLQLNVANGLILHPTASESGTIFSVPASASVEVLSSTNANVAGAFTANQVNYIGLDLRRSAADETADLVMFMDASTLLETPKNVPLARLLNYRIVISTTDFSATPHLLPIAKVTTSVTNAVTALEDARPMLYRLGSGGSVPDRYNSYGWPSGRLENTSGSIFSGGDKILGSMKDWQDAIMTRLWELGGGQYWYSATSDREVKLLFGQPIISATGDNFQWTLGTQTLQWISLSVAFGNSAVAFNTIADGSAVLPDNSCLYVDIDRTSAATLSPQVASLTSLGTPTIPGSRFIIAWRKGNYVFTKEKAFEVGRTIPVANTIVYGTVRLKYAAGTASDPTVLAADANGAYSNTANANNSAGFMGTGHGTGAGMEGTGGSGGGPGLKGTGTGSSPGVLANASASNQPALQAQVGYADLPKIDRSGAIDIGTTLGTTITIGRSGQTVTLPGTVDVGTIDRAGSINIGTASSTGVTLGRAAQTTTINGTANIATIDRAGTIGIGTGLATTITIGRTGQLVSLPGTVGPLTTNGNITIPSANTYSYSGGQTRWQHVSALEFSLPASVTLTSASGSIPFLENGSGSNLGVYAQVRLPAGATILALEILTTNATGSDQTFNCHLSTYSYHSTNGYDPITVVANASATVASGSIFTSVWASIAMTSTATTVPTDGFTRLSVIIPGGGTGALRLLSARIQYRLDFLAPNA